MERKSLGSYIAALRKVNSLTQKDMAEKLGVSELTVASWERGESMKKRFHILAGVGSFD